MEISLSKVAQVVLFAHEMDRGAAELRAFIDGLNQDEKAELVTLAWIGRGSFEADEWADALRTAYEEATTPTADYLMGMPHLGDHLDAGAEAMGLDLNREEEDLL